jgi:hypothetical protein
MLMTCVVGEKNQCGVIPIFIYQQRRNGETNFSKSILRKNWTKAN